MARESKPERNFLDFKGLSKEDKKFIADRMDGLANRVDQLAKVIEANKQVKIHVTCKCESASGGGDTQPAIDAVKSAFSNIKSAVEGITV